VPPTIAMVAGVITATFGGILRDIVAGEPSVLMRPEIYVSAALVGAGAYVGLLQLGVPDLISTVLAVSTAFIVRGGALHFGWKFPVYKARAGREPEDLSRLKKPTK
jgi:uncharacterized membrane protein YeiH